MIGMGANLTHRQAAIHQYCTGADLDFDFVAGTIAPTEGRYGLSVIRSGNTATRYNPSGVMEFVPADTPRLDYNPAVLRYENMIVSSEDFTPAVWNKQGCTTSLANQRFYGSVNAFTSKIAETTGGTGHFIYQNRVATNETTTFFVDVVSDERSWINLSMSNFSTNSCGASFNLGNGTFLVEGANADYTSPSATMTALGEGIYRCRLTVTKGSVNTVNNPQVSINNGTTNSYSGVNGSGIHIIKAQLNSGSTMLEYKKTGESAYPKEYLCSGIRVEPITVNVVRNGAPEGNGTYAEPGPAMGPDGVHATKVIPWPINHSVNTPSSGNGTVQTLTHSSTSGVTADYAYSEYLHSTGPLAYRPFIIFQAYDAGFSNQLYALVLFDPATGTFGTPSFSAGWTSVATPTATLQPCGMWLVTWVCRFTQQAVPRVNVGQYLQIYNHLGQSLYVADGVSGIQRACGQFEIGINGPTSYTLNEAFFSSRGSTKYVADVTGLLALIGANVAPVSFDPTTLKPVRMLNEPAATNLLWYSEEMNTTPWAGFEANVTPNVGQAPNGLNTVDQLIPTTAAAPHYREQVITGTFTDGDYYTQSFYVLANGYGFARLEYFYAIGSTGGQGATFDLTTGAVSGASAGVIFQAKKHINGFWRISISAKVDTATTYPTSLLCRIFAMADATNKSFTGNGTSAIRAWGAMCSSGAMLSSYVPTAGGTATRAADVVVNTAITRNADAPSMPVGPWYNPLRGTMLVEGQLSYVGGKPDTRYPWAIGFDSNNSTGERMGIFWNESDDRLNGYLRDDAAVLVGMTAVAVTPANTTFKAVMAYQLNDFALSLNGATCVTDNAGTVPTVDTMRVGGGDNAWCGHIRRVAYWNVRHTNAHMQQLSA